MLSWLAGKMIARNMRSMRAGDPGPTLAMDADDIKFTFPGESSFAPGASNKRELEQWLDRFVEHRAADLPRRGDPQGVPLAPDDLRPRPHPPRRPRGRAGLRQPLRDLGPDRLGEIARVRGLRGHRRDAAGSTSTWRARRSGAVAKKADPEATAVRAVVRGEVQGVGFRDATVARARELGVMGWVRNGEDGEVLVHAEGPEPAVEELVAFLREGPRGARVAEVEVEARQGRGPRAVRDPRRQRRRLRRPGARRHRPPLRPAPGGRRGDALLGGPEGPVDGPRRQAPRRPGRGPRRSPTTTSRARSARAA